MTLTLVTTILATAIASFALGKAQGKPHASDGKTTGVAQTQQALRQMEDETFAAFMKSDTIVLERIWADEYTLTPPNGIVLGKADYLTMLRSGAIKYEILKPEEIKVQVYDDTAVVTGLLTVKGKAPGHTFNGQDRYLTVYVKRGGQWQQVATQAVRVAR